VTAASGKYVFRAYTNWMKNAGAAFFFQKNITIVNPQLPLSLPVIQVKLTEPDIQFFPEGGNLVSGLQSRVACKVTTPAGGMAFTGIVTDENNNTVASFSAMHAGIGSFMFTPQAGHRYKATIETADRQKLTREMPAAYDEGYTMRLSDAGGDQLQLHLESTLIPANYTCWYIPVNW
jgi:hypothetical protein